MDPTATGALIAGGAALIGFAASGWQNSRTIRANNTAAREQRLWDRKAALYEAVVAQLRQLDEVKSEDDVEELLTSMVELSAKVALYATDRVADRYEKFFNDVASTDLPETGGRQKFDRDLKSGRTSVMIALRDDVQQRPRAQTAFNVMADQVKRRYRRYIRLPLWHGQVTRQERRGAQTERDDAEEADGQGASDLP